MSVAEASHISSLESGSGIVVDGLRTWFEEGVRSRAPSVGSWSALPNGGFYTLAALPVRPPQAFTIDVPPHTLSRLKGYRFSRSFYNNLPLSSFRTRSSGPAYALTPVGRLPSELILEIITLATIQRTLEGDRHNANEIHDVQSMGLVCLTWMSVVASNHTLWGRLMASAATPKQRFIVQLLAGHAALDLAASGTERPRDLKPYIFAARTLNVTSIGEEWAQFVGSRHLPALRMLSFKNEMSPSAVHKPRWVEIDAPSLEHLCINRRVRFMSPVHLRSVRFKQGSGTGGADDAEEFRELLRLSRNTLEELQIDGSLYQYFEDHEIIWHEVLNCLCGGPLRYLRVLHNDGNDVFDYSPVTGLNFPNLQFCITASLLCFDEPPPLERAEIRCDDLTQLRVMLHGFTSTRSLSITFRRRSLVDRYMRPSPDPIIFPNLRSLVASSPLDMNFIQLLYACDFPRLSHMEVQIDVPLACPQVETLARKALDCDLSDAELDYPDDRSDDSLWCRHQEADRISLQHRIEALESIFHCFDRILSGPATLTIATRAHLGESIHQTTFSLVDENMSRKAGTTEELRPVGLHVCVLVDSAWCRCTMRSGYPASAVHALTAVAHHEVVRVRSTVDIVIPHHAFGPALFFDTCPPDVLNRGRRFAFWTPPDPLATSDRKYFHRLCTDISRMRKVEELQVDVVRSYDYVGIGILKALIANNTSELAGGGPFYTFQKLNRLVFTASGTRRSMRIAKRRSKFWEELVEVARLRRCLHERGKSPPLHIVLAGNFCRCQMPVRDEVHIRKLQSLATVSLELLTDGCVQCIQVT